MPLDGLRAWIGEVERKLGMRTRVFLVLATIAIGGAGAAIYLALDTREDAVSESDVRDLQERLEEQIATGGAATVPTPAPVEPTEPQPQPAPSPEPGADQDGDDATGESSGATPGGGVGVAEAGSKAPLRELANEAKQETAAAEAAPSK
ncbi:MAG TPA: hypothetical protein VFU04_00530 [Solirubrobacterales bacterium]|nr:hypothetical protein [Solirubrobacterales bacterium]